MSVIRVLCWASALTLSCGIVSGCSAAVAVVDATVTVVATGVKITAKTVGAVADAVIPDGDDEDDDKDDKAAARSDDAK